MKKGPIWIGNIVKEVIYNAFQGGKLFYKEMIFPISFTERSPFNISYKLTLFQYILQRKNFFKVFHKGRLFFLEKKSLMDFHDRRFCTALYKGKPILMTSIQIRHFKERSFLKRKYLFFLYERNIFLRTPMDRTHFQFLISKNIFRITKTFFYRHNTFQRFSMVRGHFEYLLYIKGLGKFFQKKTNFCKEKNFYIQNTFSGYSIERRSFRGFLRRKDLFNKENIFKRYSTDRRRHTCF